MTTRLYELPVPPPLTAYYRLRVIKRASGFLPIHYISTRGKEFRQECREVIALQYPDAQEFRGRLAVNIIIHLKQNRKFDLDNRLKGLLDIGTAAGIWVDDSQIDDLRIRRGEKRQDGVCFMQVEEIHD